MRKRRERGRIAEISAEISGGAIRVAGNDSPSGGQARPLGESICTGKADANDGTMEGFGLPNLPWVYRSITRAEAVNFPFLRLTIDPARGIIPRHASLAQQDRAIAYLARDVPFSETPNFMLVPVAQQDRAFAS
jgi:hypothetical protein